MPEKDQWQRLNAIWELALKVEPGRRPDFVRESCAGDESLQAELESLLRQEKNADHFLEPPEPSHVSIPTGRMLAHYQVLDKLGEGGMGSVYKARDTHLDRFVAIKILQPGRVADPSRKARFVQEAKAASALNHPNIVHIYDICSDASLDFIAMEFVAGRTLDELISSKGMRVTDALKIAVQIADALARAHAAGIIHRDLKPANIMVDDHGMAKVLDFGLAKLLEQDTYEDKSTAPRAVRTEDGIIVGTAAYMSPEQAEHRPLDARSDIFSFGLVLYEMVTGRRAFHGESPISTLSAVLHRQPEPVPADVPRDVERLIARCLRKDPGWRFQTMADLKVALAELAMESDGSGLDARTASTAVRSRWKLAAVLGVLTLAGAAAGLWMVRDHPPQASAALTVVPLTTYSGNEISPTFSPDGSQVAFSWDGEKQDNYDIYVKLVDGGPPLRLTTDPAKESSPAWSQDGRWIAFQRDGADAGVYLIAPLGGPERRMTVAGAILPCWTPDARSLVYSYRDSEKAPFCLWRVSINSGERQRVTSPPESYLGDVGCAVSPNGEDLVFGRWVLPGFGAGIWLVPLAGGQPRRLTTENVRAQSVSWLPSGSEIVFAASGESATTAWFFGGGSLWRLRIPAAGEAEPQRLGEADEMSGWPSISRPGPGRPAFLAFVRYEWDTNIWRLDLAARGPSRSPAVLCSSTRGEIWPAISPDGRKIIFASQRSGRQEIWSCDTDGSNAVQLTNGGGVVGTPSWSPDGRRIAFDILDRGNRDVYVMNPDGTGIRRMTNDPANDGRPTWSTDGRWIYFHSARTGTHEIWKIPAEGGQGIQLTRGGGSEPRESRNGGIVYYVKSISHGGLWSVHPDGGHEKEILAGIRRGDWTVGPRGVYFIGATIEGFKRRIQLLDPATGKLTDLGATEDAGPLPDVPRLSVSPDGKWLVWVQFDRLSADLMLIENFQ